MTTGPIYQATVLRNPQGACRTGLQHSVYFGIGCKAKCMLQCNEFGLPVVYSRVPEQTNNNEWAQQEKHDKINKRDMTN
eukprot:4641596-Amphidinium_carterae.1